MGISISTAIMAHPSRKEWVNQLLEKIDDSPTVVWDRKNDIWDTGRRTLLSNENKDYHLIIQDDTVVCRDLVAGVKNALQYVPPGHPVCLYYSNTSPARKHHQTFMQANRRGMKWVSTNKSPMWGIGLVIPTEHIEDIVKFGDKIYISTGGIYDGKISKWYYTNGIYQYYTLPSLVNHRNHAESNKSIVGHGNGRGRVARFWIGEDKSALSIDWNTSKMKIEV